MITVGQLAQVSHGVESRELVDGDALFESHRLDRYVGDAMKHVPLLVQVLTFEQEFGETRHGDDEKEADEHAHGAKRKSLSCGCFVVQRVFDESGQAEQRLAACQTHEQAYPVGAHRAVRVRAVEVDDRDELGKEDHVDEIGAQEPETVHRLDRYAHDCCQCGHHQYAHSHHP